MEKNEMQKSLLLVALLLSACSPIQHTSSFAQPLDTIITAGVGETIIAIDKEKSMPNIFGKADMYGRTTPTGKVFIQYLGFEDNAAYFLRRTVHIETGATTMNSSPFIVPNRSTTHYSGNFNGMAYNGTSTTTSSPTIILPDDIEIDVMGENDFVFKLDLDENEKSIYVAGKEAQILNADDTKIVYKIRNQ